MGVVKISKYLEYISYVGILALMTYYIFLKPKVEYLLICLLVVCVLRMIASTLKANYFEKEYNKLKEDNEFMQRRVDELEKKDNINN